MPYVDPLVVSLAVQRTCIIGPLARSRSSYLAMEGLDRHIDRPPSRIGERDFPASSCERSGLGNNMDPDASELALSLLGSLKGLWNWSLASMMAPQQVHTSSPVEGSCSNALS
jgi:hypothetical protein